MSLSRIYWPNTLSGMWTSATLGETVHVSMNMDAAGEKLGLLVPFDGSELAEITLALNAGVAATTIQITIQDALNNDNINSGGYPDGTPIANSTVSVSGKGGSAEVVTWAYSGTGPSPSGYFWIVIAPSGGSFNIQPRYSPDWALNSSSIGGNSGVRLFTASAWSGAVSFGTPILRVKKKDGTYLLASSLVFPPFTSLENAHNARQCSGTTVVGAKFTAPFTGPVVAAHVSLAITDNYVTHHVLLVDASDNVLATAETNTGWGIGNRNIEIVFPVLPTITAGETYRIVFTNPLQDGNRLQMNTVSMLAGQYAFFGMSDNEVVFTTATNPPCIGGGGSYTDTNLELPLFQIVGLQDLSAGGGGGGGSPVTLGYGQG